MHIDLPDQRKYLCARFLGVEGETGSAVAVLDEVALLDADGEPVQRTALRFRQEISRPGPSLGVLQELLWISLNLIHFDENPRIAGVLLTHIYHAVQVRVDLQGLVLEGVEGVHRCDIPSSKFGKQILHLSEMFYSEEYYRCV